MIDSRVYRVKQPIEIMKGITLQKGQELEIVRDVVYMNGYPIPPEMQPIFYAFIINNPTLFEDDTRQW